MTERPKHPQDEVVKVSATIKGPNFILWFVYLEWIIFLCCSTIFHNFDSIHHRITGIIGSDTLFSSDFIWCILLYPLSDLKRHNSLLCQTKYFKSEYFSRIRGPFTYGHVLIVTGKQQEEKMHTLDGIQPDVIEVHKFSSSLVWRSLLLFFGAEVSILNYDRRISMWWVISDEKISLSAVQMRWSFGKFHSMHHLHNSHHSLLFHFG